MKIEATKHFKQIYANTYNLVNIVNGIKVSQLLFTPTHRIITAQVRTAILGHLENE